MFKESDIVLSAKHIVKQFPASHGRTLTACNDINLNVYKGKTLGIVGESGCGKSTFVRMVISLDKPTSGEILYHGKNLADLSKKETWLNRQNMQMVFQDPFSSLNPARKIGWIMEEPLKLKGIKDKKQRKEMVDQMLVEIGLDPSFANRYARELSGGQRQRISIGLSLMRGEKLIIADEPVSALDVTVQSQILRLLLKLHDEKNLTYMFISHDLNVVHHMCHRVIVMYLGRIVEMADVDELYDHPVIRIRECCLTVSSRMRKKQQQIVSLLMNYCRMPVRMRVDVHFTIAVTMPVRSA